MRFLNELTENFRIAFEQLWVHRMRSLLTMLGVIIGVIAVTLMGAAIRGIDQGFSDSLDMIGQDVFFVQKWPWGDNEGNWWEIRRRPKIEVEYADQLNRIFAETPNSNLMVAVASKGRQASVRYESEVAHEVWIQGTQAAMPLVSPADFAAGRFFTESEVASAARVAILGHDVADVLFGTLDPIGKTIRTRGYDFEVIGVYERQGEFLGLWSFDNYMAVPLTHMDALRTWWDTEEIRVKAQPGVNLTEAEEELIGAVRRVRGLMPGEENDFALNRTESIEDDIGPIKQYIGIAGVFITGLALFVGAIGIMNITFVSVKERTREIGTRRALGAQRRSILTQFLVEAVTICMLGGLVGLLFARVLTLAVGVAAPNFPITFSPDLVIIAVAVSVMTGLFSGFAPAFTASRLDPAEALRYE